MGVEAQLAQLRSLEKQAAILDPLDHVGTISQSGSISGQVPSIYDLETQAGVRLTQPPPLLGAGLPFTELQPGFRVGGEILPEEGEQNFGYEEHF